MHVRGTGGATVAPLVVLVPVGERPAWQIEYGCLGNQAADQTLAHCACQP